jgi:hypothetical protein
MTDARVEENTQFISTWILNDPDHYYFAIDAAFHSAQELESVVMNILKEADGNTVAGYTHAQMNGCDYDYVNWDEIREALLS